MHSVRLNKLSFIQTLGSISRYYDITMETLWAGTGLKPHHSLVYRNPYTREMLPLQLLAPFMLALTELGISLEHQQLLYTSLVKEKAQLI